MSTDGNLLFTVATALLMRPFIPSTMLSFNLPRCSCWLWDEDPATTEHARVGKHTDLCLGGTLGLETIAALVILGALEELGAGRIRIAQPHHLAALCRLRPSRRAATGAVSASNTAGSGNHMAIGSTSKRGQWLEP